MAWLVCERIIYLTKCNLILGNCFDTVLISHIEKHMTLFGILFPETVNILPFPVF